MMMERKESEDSDSSNATDADQTHPGQAPRWKNRGWLVGCVELLVLGVWIGGLVIIIAIVIPAVFNSFGMEPAGHFLRRVFDGYNMVVVGVLVCLVLTSSLRMRLAGPLSFSGIPLGRMETGLLIAALLVTLVIVFWLGPKAVSLQEMAFAAAPGAERKAAYDEFFRLHMIVRALHMLNWGIGVSLFVAKVKRWVGNPRTMSWSS